MGLCDKFRSKVKTMLKKLDRLLTENVDKALEISTKLKAALTSSVALLITSVIPGDWDEKVRSKAVIGLELALKYLGWIKEGQAFTANVLTDFKDWLSQQPKAVQDAYLAKTASIVAKQLDQRHDINVYDSAVQLQYSLNYK